MKLAIVGSRNITRVNIEEHISNDVTEIVSGGALGVDTLAKGFAKEHGIKFTEFLPEYNIYGKAAPIKRNQRIAEYADASLVFWNGSSKGTEHTIKFFKDLKKPVKVIVIEFKFWSGRPDRQMSMFVQTKFVCAYHDDEV